MVIVGIVLVGVIIGVIINNKFYKREYINIIGLHIQLENLRKKNGIRVLDREGQELYGKKLRDKLEETIRSNEQTDAMPRK